MSGKSRRNAKIAGSHGSFISVRLTGDHITLAVEGRDQDEPSVAGMSLSLEDADKLSVRLARVRLELSRRLGRPVALSPR